MRRMILVPLLATAFFLLSDPRYAASSFVGVGELPGGAFNSAARSV